MRFFYLNLFLIIILLCGFTSAQQNVIDSLETELNFADGEYKVGLLNKLSDLYQYSSTEKAIEYAEKGIELAKSINYKKGEASGYGSLGYCLINVDQSKAIEYTNKALSLRKEINDVAGMSRSLNVLGVIYYYSGDYLHSIEHHINAIKIKETLGNKIQSATSYNNISLVYMAVDDYEKALEYLQMALEVRIATKNERGEGIIRTNIGDIYLRLGEYEKAKDFYTKAQILNKKVGSTGAEANTYNSLGRLSTFENEYDKGAEYYNESLKLYEILKIKNGISNAHNGLANIYKIKKNFNKAIQHAKIALENAQNISSLQNVYKAADILFYSYQQEGDYKQAFNYLLINKNSQDSLVNETKLKKISKIELDHKIASMKLEQEKELNKQKSFNQYLILLLVSGSIILLLILFSWRAKKQTNIKLYELNSQLHKNNAAKDRFLSIIAHDLRGPYQSNLGTTEILARNFESLTTAEKKDSINNLHTSLIKQYELLENLLKWANLQRGNFKFHKMKMSLSQSVDSVFDLLQPIASKKNIRLINNISHDLFISADKNMFDLLLRNLITNGIKFSEKDNFIEVTGEAKDGEIQISIADNGIGMNESVIKDLFKIDVHYSIKGTNNEEGSGLGLILCKEIIEKHGGSIWAESEVNKGSKFIFTLPA